MPSYAVVGASRGIGLEYVRQLASRSDAVVFAVVRSPETSTHLKDVAAGFKNIHIIAGDVTDHSTLEASPDFIV
uniref:Adenylate cyclase n=1 Tax=Ganoderma boninense TaxID=34458 RepID=A0A5K1K4T3_9APHY|nr:Adenylate cyclase [Ganoderma boninense]